MRFHQRSLPEGPDRVARALRLVLGHAQHGTGPGLPATDDPGEVTEEMNGVAVEEVPA